jgi:hypothetical protein
VYFTASPAGTMLLKSTLKDNATTVILNKPNTTLAVTGQTINIPGAINNPFTVTSDSFGALPPHVPDVVTVTPAVNTGSPTTTIAGGATVTVNATTNTPFRSVNDAVFSNSTTVTSATANFVNAVYPAGDVGAPISGELGGKAFGFPPPGNAPSPTNVLGAAIPGDILAITAVNSATSVTVAAIPSIPTTVNNGAFVPPAVYPGNEPSSTTWAGASGSGGVITIGETLAAPLNVYGTNRLAASGCQTGTAFSAFGNYAPPTATMVGLTQVAVSNAAIALENVPAPTTFTITYPPVAPLWADNGGTGTPGVQPTNSLDFHVKNLFVLSALAKTIGACNIGSVNCDSYQKGITNWNPTGGPLGLGAPNGDYGTGTKGNLGLAANGMVFCTVGETEGINHGTGPDAALSGLNPLNVCDGGPANPTAHDKSAALNVIINLELNPQASVFGSDHTAPTSIWNIVSSNASNAVW